MNQITIAAALSALIASVTLPATALANDSPIDDPERPPAHAPLAIGATDPDPENSVSLNPLGLALGGLNLTYTRALGGTVTVGLMAVYVAPIVADVSVLGGGLELLAWPDRALDGFFIGPYVQLSRSNVTDEANYLGATALTPGVVLGWRWLWNGGFNVGVGAGVGYAVALSKDECPSGYACTSMGEGVTPRVLIDLGYAF